MANAIWLLLESDSLVWTIMSGESPSVAQKPSNRAEIVRPSVDNPVVGEEFVDRLVHERTVANLRVFWADRKFILRTGFYALLASAVISLVIPVRYQTVTKLMPPDSQSGLGGMLSLMTGRLGMQGSGGSGGTGGLGGIAGDLLGAKSSGALFVGVIQSQTVQDRLIRQFNLMNVYHDGKIEDARKDLEVRTDVSEDRKSGIISIGVTDHDPKRATAMAKTYVDELDRLVAQVSTSAARRERIFLETRLKAVKGELDDSAKNFSDFASKNTAIDIPAQGRAMVEAAARLQGELIAVQSELEGLKQVYTDDNVRVRSARARMDELQKKLNEIGSAGTEGGAKSNDMIFPSIRRLPILGVTYADLYRRTKIEETVFELLTQQYELAKVQEAKEIPSVKVLDAPVLPTKKTFPPRAVIISVGTLFGLALAMTWIAAKKQWEAVEATDPRKQFAMEVFTTTRASLPSFSRNGSNGSSNGHGPSGWWKKTVEPTATKHEDGEPGAK